MQLSSDFRHTTVPGTGRKCIQLTSGPATCYPLYYFVPSFSRDGNQLVYHRAEAGEIQLFSLDLQTGQSTQLTQAQAAETHWIPWCVDSGRGVLDHRSVLNVMRDQVIYFDDTAVRQVNLDGTSDRLLFNLPPDRIAIGQNCVSADGVWFVYIHHDRALFAEIYARQPRNRCLSRGTVLAAYNLDTGEERTLVNINSPIHHVLPYGSEQFIFCHPATENGMLLTDLNGGWYSHLRTQDSSGGCVCHYVATEAGVAYEVLGRKDAVWSGLYNPLTHQRYEFRMPANFGYTHTGRDPEGRLWIYENSTADSHDLWFLAAHHPKGEDEWLALSGNWPTYGGGQKSHFHPQICPDRNWLLMTGGDPETGTNHLFLVDISDLTDTVGIPPML